ncbi:MAG: efflux RND transporter periplasmic adaptor subunit [Alkalibacterium gilvum]|uniref:HlyD family secretion protein n=1 Tax=Alkalibacterium gilvum TaxID=1130080 RepID=A0A1H6SPY9_9LACT|nr:MULTISPECIES: HlyD family efflux transporter periplasmic adaptor subunit [Alkalibacterium]MDN6293890.1 HlyD family efflux transporter periplasmic adaptor subunit [Alkalibacterium sp.]MDN6295865.1 HlyD family efflux transporter periplasmic adaptor subunit [Alkalibacterium sp.]MDN6397962.1 HlyD family efflux transporter periplasmic adaptor subunit [Alkalibacterium sp.]SEI69903.1 HlyD family secretion protein [Alkalibacterium gilvum]HAJ70045.1 RND transporter [Alkalibacterium sp.]
MKGKKWIGLILFLAFIGFVSYSIYSSQQEEVTATVRTAEVKKEDITEKIVTTGIIEPSESQQVFGQGIVSELAVSVGDSVTEGDTLVSYVNGTSFEAEFNGTVTEVNIKEESNDTSAQQGRASIVVENLNDLQVALQLSRSDAGEVQVDQNVTMTYNDTEFEGLVSKIDPVATQQQTQTGAATLLGATVTFDSDTSELIAGFEIDVDIIVDSQKSVMVIPVETLNYNENNEPYVYIVNEGIAERKDIKTGIQSEAIIEVQEGLSDGDKVILSPSSDVKDGLEVELDN